jgi:hypothetical protein
VGAQRRRADGGRARTIAAVVAGALAKWQQSQSLEIEEKKRTYSIVRKVRREDK